MADYKFWSLKMETLGKLFSWISGVVLEHAENDEAKKEYSKS